MYRPIPHSFPSSKGMMIGQNERFYIEPSTICMTCSKVSEGGGAWIYSSVTRKLKGLRCEACMAAFRGSVPSL